MLAKGREQGISTPEDAAGAVPDLRRATAMNCDGQDGRAPRMGPPVSAVFGLGSRVRAHRAPLHHAEAR